VPALHRADAPPQARQPDTDLGIRPHRGPALRPGQHAADDADDHSVLVLWQSGSWDLAIIVFVASVLVPVLKIVVLMVLLVSVHRRWNWGQLERARLYRFIEGIGRWSMLDIFVVALLIALVRFQGLSQVNAGAGAVAFAAVAILTMLASRSFDPRFIWDTPRRPETTA
jgi:paraquat-inducible protein A